MRHLFTSFLLFSLFTFVSFRLNAQLVFGYSFNAVESVQCPWDSSKTVKWPTGWTVYQTLNDNWGGPVDSSRCIGAAIVNGRVTIGLSQIDPARALFIRAGAETVQSFGTGVFKPNSIYRSNAYSELTGGTAAALKVGADCPEDVCTGMFIGIGIPDANGTANAALRVQTNIVSGMGSTQFWEACFPTERFDTQSLREVILKYTFEPGGNLAQGFLRLNGASIYTEPFFDQPGLVTEVKATSDYFVNNQYQVPIGAVASGGNASVYLMQYTAPTYPGPQQLSYVEATPEPNTAAPQLIVLNVSEFESIHFQPFVQFRGGLTEGSETTRHLAFLNNQGGDMCLNFVDLIFSDGDEFRFSHGVLDFHNPYACMQFRRGSALRVMDNGKLHYGRNGAGMLLLCATSTIALERNASITIDGLLMLNECEPDMSPQHIYMDLPAGTSLHFTENARISNQFSQNQAMRLRVRMKGGTLDDAALDPASRALIERIYPEPSPDMNENVSLFPNPVRQALSLQYLAGIRETVQVKWLYLNGQLCAERQFVAEKGINKWEMPAPAAPGAYLIQVSGQQGTVLKKAVVVE